MKKLLIFMLVLCVASAANAGLVISIHEVGGAEYDGRTLAYSDYLWLDVEAIDGDTGAQYFVLMADTSLATISGGVALVPPAPDGSMHLGAVSANYFTSGVPVGYDGIVGAVDHLLSPPPPYPDGVYFDEILFHCEGAGDVEIVLMLVDTATWSVTTTELDSITIPQVPEPMTVLLLGLGGLFLRRRR